MHMKKLLSICFVCMSFVSVFGQIDNTDNHTVTVIIPEVALLDLESAGLKNFTMNFTAPTEEGLGIGNPDDNEDVWLNYTSIIKPSTIAAGRTINVKTQAAPPGGINFTVKAAPYSGIGGGGTPGTRVNSNLTISTTPINIITGIKSCFTGNGPTNGHKLTYGATTGPAGYSGLVSGTKTVNIIYTLTDN